MHESLCLLCLLPRRCSKTTVKCCRLLRRRWHCRTVLRNVKTSCARLHCCGVVRVVLLSCSTAPSAQLLRVMQTDQPPEKPAWWDDEEERRIRFEVQYRYGLMKVGSPLPRPYAPSQPFICSCCCGRCKLLRDRIEWTLCSAIDTLGCAAELYLGTH